MTSGLCWGQSANLFSVSAPVFTNSLKEESSSGHIKIVWVFSSSQSEIGKGYDFEVQKSSNPDFDNAIVIYRGDDLATYLSGLADGQYYFRLRIIDENGLYPVSAWSNSLQLTVKHHSLQLALVLFLLGAFVFMATVFVLIKGLKDCEVAS